MAATWTQGCRVAVTAALLSVVLGGCATAPPAPTEADEDAYLRAYVESVVAAARASGQTPTSADTALSNLTAGQRDRGVQMGHDSCARLREDPGDAANTIRLGRGIAADNELPVDPLDALTIAVEHLCPDLEPELDQVVADLT
jgi:hypothetical protein